VNGVVQEGNASPQDSAKNFRNNQAERRGHGPAKHRRPERRMYMAGVTVAMVMRMTGVAVIMDLLVAVGMRIHRYHSTHSLDASQPPDAYWAF